MSRLRRWGEHGAFGHFDCALFHPSPFRLHHSASAQYAITWSKIAGGGGLQSTGGVYSVSGTNANSGVIAEMRRQNGDLLRRLEAIEQRLK